MRPLDKALCDIAAMRSQMARSTVFRGYGPLTFVATGLLAAVAALLQPVLLPNPAANIQGYLALWTGTAFLSLVLIGAEVVMRSRRLHSGLADEMIMQAIEQFLPAGAAGVLLTLVLVKYAPESLWMLPGLWQIILSLGIFASCRSLPAPMLAVGFWYMGTGLASLAIANGAQAFSAIAMGLPFLAGQLMAAAVVQFAGGADDDV
jgi:hypothetical protein